MTTMRTATITPAMTGILLLFVGNCVVAPSVVGVAGIVPSAVVVLVDGTGAASPVVAVSNGVTVIIESVGGVNVEPVLQKQYPMLKF